MPTRIALRWVVEAAPPPITATWVLCARRHAISPNGCASFTLPQSLPTAAVGNAMWIGISPEFSKPEVRSGAFYLDSEVVFGPDDQSLCSHQQRPNRHSVLAPSSKNGRNCSGQNR